jgi:aryl-alcohol dehydrogenase-like predicted oxidoreductase
MQNQYNLLYREEEREMIRFCNATGVGVIPWGPLAHGTLARPPPSTDTDSNKATASIRSQSHPSPSAADSAIITRVSELATKKGWSMSHVALAWLNVRVAAPIIGLSSVERLEEALAANGKVLTEEEEKGLEELYVAREVVGFDTRRDKGGRIFA